MGIVEFAAVLSAVGLLAVIEEIARKSPRAFAEIIADTERFARAPRPLPPAAAVVVWSLVERGARAPT